MQVIAAPSNLGLRPLREGHMPGTCRAPQALFDAGLIDAVGAATAIELARPDYSPNGPKAAIIQAD
jgi:arginase